MSDPYLSEIRIFSGNFAPRGWALCDGAALPISSNTALFSLLGTTYGGDGISTFKLPDLRGRTPIHPGQGAGLSNYNLGDVGGTEAVILTENELPAHTHTLPGRSGPATSGAPSGNVPGQASIGVVYKSAGTTVAMDPAALSAAASGAHTNMAPYLGLTFIIAIVGVFPSRN
jgi:microcystin-dependent protein